MSNKTHEKQPSETESAHSQTYPKNKRYLIFGIILIIVGGLVVYNGVSSLFDNTIRLLAPKGYITVEVVDTPELRQLGLSGRESLSEGEGMLFEFDTASSGNCLVMRDMLISLDMVWLNEDREVITVKQNATPESYPEEVFCPVTDAKYALEIASGRAESLGIVDGEKLRW